VFSVGPLKADFFRRAKTRPPDAGVPWYAFPLLEAVSLNTLPSPLLNEERTTRMLGGKFVLVLGVDGSTLIEV